MSYRVGTLVTRYYGTSDSSGYRTCEDGVCVGKVTEIIQWESEPDKDTIVVKWLDRCEWHKPGVSNIEHRLPDELWEIGQTD